MSEVPFLGRRPIYLGVLTVFVFFNFSVVYAKKTGMLRAVSFLTGSFGGPVLATGGASIAGWYKPRKRPCAMAFYSMANVPDPFMGPLGGICAAGSTSITASAKA